MSKKAQMTIAAAIAIVAIVAVEISGKADLAKLVYLFAGAVASYVVVAAWRSRHPITGFLQTSDAQAVRIVAEAIALNSPPTLDDWHSISDRLSLLVGYHSASDRFGIAMRTGCVKWDGLTIVFAPYRNPTQ